MAYRSLWRLSVFISSFVALNGIIVAGPHRRRSNFMNLCLHDVFQPVNIIYLFADLLEIHRLGQLQRRGIGWTEKPPLWRLHRSSRKSGSIQNSDTRVRRVKEPAGGAGGLVIIALMVWLLSIFRHAAEYDNHVSFSPVSDRLSRQVWPQFLFAQGHFISGR